MRYLQVPPTKTPPKVFYTLKGNSFSEKVIEKLRELKKDAAGYQFEVFEEMPNQTEESFRTHSVALFDSNESNRNFTPNATKKPSWVISYWSVAIKLKYEHRAEDCANQVFAWFKRTVDELNRGMLPWGYPKKGTVVLNGEIPKVSYGQPTRTTLKSTMGPFTTYHGSKVIYPEKVLLALGQLYEEYNAAFGPLIINNLEWKTDYQYCLQDGPTNWAIQIDMKGLDEEFLARAEDMDLDTLREELRKQIFEIENSLAMYQLLTKAFQNGSPSYFDKKFRHALDALRHKYGKKIALLAVTEEKYDAMRKTEFGKNESDVLTNNEVLELSGFDRLFGPKEFAEYLATAGDECEYLLYCRTSDPIRKLKDPAITVEHPLLGNMEYMRIIKANSITLNIDRPVSQFGQRINDTKEYMIALGMGIRIQSIQQLETLSFAPDVKLRAKPMKGTYGCYGHVIGHRGDSKFQISLKEQIRLRGDYIIQPEMRTPILLTADTAFTYIDRVFFAIVDGQPTFLGGFRNMMPLDSIEARNARIHGNEAAAWVEIVS